MSWQIQLILALPIVASAAVYSKVVALLLCINYCCSHSLSGLYVISLFWFAVLYVLYRFEDNMLEKRNMFDMPLLDISCHVTAIILCTFIRAPSAGLKYVIVTLSDHTQFRFINYALSQQYLLTYFKNSQPL